VSDYRASASTPPRATWASPVSTASREDSSTLRRPRVGAAPTRCPAERAPPPISALLSLWSRCPKARIVVLVKHGMQPGSAAAHSSNPATIQGCESQSPASSLERSGGSSCQPIAYATGGVAAEPAQQASRGARLERVAFRIPPSLASHPDPRRRYRRLFRCPRHWCPPRGRHRTLPGTLLLQPHLPVPQRQEQVIYAGSGRKHAGNAGATNGANSVQRHRDASLISDSFCEFARQRDYLSDRPSPSPSHATSESRTSLGPTTAPCPADKVSTSCLRPHSVHSSARLPRRWDLPMLGAGSSSTPTDNAWPSGVHPPARQSRDAVMDGGGAGRLCTVNFQPSPSSTDSTSTAPRDESPSRAE